MPASPASLPSPPPAPAPRPVLVAVPPPARRRVPRAEDVRMYALGLTVGFVLATLASSAVGGPAALAIAGAIASGLVALTANVRVRRSTRPSIEASGGHAG